MKREFKAMICLDNHGLYPSSLESGFGSSVQFKLKPGSEKMPWLSLLFCL